MSNPPTVPINMRERADQPSGDDPQAAADPGAVAADDIPADPPDTHADDPEAETPEVEAHHAEISEPETPGAESPDGEAPEAEPADVEATDPVHHQAPDPADSQAPDTVAMQTVGSHTEAKRARHSENRDSDIQDFDSFEFADAETEDEADAKSVTTQRWWTRKRIWIPAAVLAAFAAFYAADLLLAGKDIPRNTVVGGVAIGGLSRADASALLNEELSAPVSAPRDILAGEVDGRLNSGAAGITLDLEGSTVQAAEQPLNPWTRLLSLFADRTVDPVLSVDEGLFETAIGEFAETVDLAPIEGAITFDGLTPVAVDPVPGFELDQSGAASAFLDAVRADPAGRVGDPVRLPIDDIAVSTSAEDVQEALDSIAGPALAAPITVVGMSQEPDGGPTAVEIPVTAIAASLRFVPDGAGALEPMIDPQAMQTAMGEAFAPFTTPARDADFAIVGGAMTIVASVDGTSIDLNVLSENIIGVLTDPAPREVEATLVGAPAELTTEDATALGITEVVSTFTTNYTAASSGENIRVVSAEVDGAVVLPGETFSLNGYTGPRTEAEGYVPAGVIIAGEFQQAVGGGVSQFATTTFNAVFFAGLEDIYHKPHSYYISRYPAGREATVFYDSIDLVFRNDQPTGIYIQTIWSPGSLTVTFWGTKQVDVESISSERYNYRSPQTQEKPDDGSCSPSGGSSGFDITVTRVFKQLGTGAVLRTEDFVTSYNAEPRIVCVPPGPPAPPAAPGIRGPTEAVPVRRAAPVGGVWRARSVPR